MSQARLIEMYSSPQGEGPYVGVSMLFVRFQDCALSCRFCDTPASFVPQAQLRLEQPPRSGRFVCAPNPVDEETLSHWVEDFHEPWLSLTGGEPLQQSGFLAHWLPKLGKSYRILLETNGVLPEALARVIEHVDVVSMDLKLPSVAGMKAYWKEHADFLKIACRKEVYVKVVVSAATDPNEMRRAIDLVCEQAPRIPFIIQPVSPGGEMSPSETEPVPLKALYRLAQKRLADVRVIPQVHTLLHLL